MCFDSRRGDALTAQFHDPIAGELHPSFATVEQHAVYRAKLKVVRRERQGAGTAIKVPRRRYWCSRRGPSSNDQGKRFRTRRIWLYCSFWCSILRHHYCQQNRLTLHKTGYVRRKGRMEL